MFGQPFSGRPTSQNSTFCAASFVDYSNFLNWANFKVLTSVFVLFVFIFLVFSLDFEASEAAGTEPGLGWARCCVARQEPTKRRRRVGAAGGRQCGPATSKGRRGKGEGERERGLKGWGVEGKGVMTVNKVETGGRVGLKGAGKEGILLSNEYSHLWCCCC